MPSKIFELVIASSTDAVVDAIVTGQHRRHWHPDLGDDDRDLDDDGAAAGEDADAAEAGAGEADAGEAGGDEHGGGEADPNALRWNAALDGHELTLLISPMGYSTSITAIVTVPGMLGAITLGSLAAHHKTQLQRLRLLVENGELDGYVFRGPDDPRTYHGDAEE